MQIEIARLTEQVERMEEEKETLDFFDSFLEPLSQAEKKLWGAFEEKLQKGKYSDFTVDEFSFFLNTRGMEGFVPFQREKQLTGKDLELAISVDVQILEIPNTLTQKRMKFWTKLLATGKINNEQELEKSPVWRHRDLRGTLKLLQEMEIALDKEVIEKEGVTICELIFFNSRDLMKMFTAKNKKEVVEIMGKLKRMRKSFEEFLTA